MVWVLGTRRQVAKKRESGLNEIGLNVVRELLGHFEFGCRRGIEADDCIECADDQLESIFFADKLGGLLIIHQRIKHQNTFHVQKMFVMIVAHCIQDQIHYTEYWSRTTIFGREEKNKLE